MFKVEPGGLYDPYMAKRVKLGIQDTRLHLRTRVDEGLEEGSHTVVMRHDKLVAALVPYSWYRDACLALGYPEFEEDAAPIEPPAAS
jgi:acetyl/propionyl-CoA carboxylase alpha subunit